jgi:hypothetical protein
MPDEQPRYFTLIDLIGQLTYVACISTGCYIGWQVRETFPSMFVGGVVGWAILFGIVQAIRSRLNFANQEDDLPEPR